MPLDPTYMAFNVKTPNQVSSEQMDLQTQKLTQARDQATTVAALMTSAVDQKSYEVVKQKAQNIGIDTSDEPAQFDPQYVAHIRMQGMTAAQQINDQLRLLNIQATAGEKTNDITKFGAFSGGGGMASPLSPYTLGQNSAPSQTGGTLSNPAAATAPQAYAPSPQLNNQVAQNIGATVPPNQATPPMAAQPPPVSPAQVAQAQQPDDPVQASLQAIQQQQAQTGVSPQQNPQMAALNPPAQQSMLQGPNEPTSAYKARIGKLPEGTALDRNGNVVAMPGATAAANAISGANSSGAAQGTKSTDIIEETNDQADQALATKRMILEMKNLSQNFTPGNLASMKEALGSWAISLGFDQKMVNAQLGNIGDLQDFRKFTSMLATESARSLTSRPALLEFNNFLTNNPNPNLTPEALSKMLDFMSKTQDVALDKQQFLQDWKQGKNPKQIQEDFQPAWTQHMRQNMQASLSQPTPAQPAAPPVNPAALPVFASPGDPNFQKLPSGSPFRTNDGQVKYKK